jgi:thiol-disulfide isomerase/thioredoxin
VSSVLLAVACTAEYIGAESARPEPSASPLRSLDRAGPWTNSAPLVAEQLRGKVVLIDFWTYSCINCLRTLPYVRAWVQRYKAAGLVVIGVHSPEFEFEKAHANVHQASTRLGIDFPVVEDSDFAIWRAFGNRAWPGFYFVDARGRVRHRQYGEGEYERSEQWIRQLLTEAGHGGKLPAGLASPIGEGTQAAPAERPARSSETYLGYARTSGFDSGSGRPGDGRSRTFAGPVPTELDHWSLSGDWSVETDRVTLVRSGGRIAYRFHARDLHLVLGPSADGTPVRFRLLIDGKVPGEDRGTDVDARGEGTVDTHRLYQLVRRRADQGEALFEIEFLDPGVQAYAFTFG